MKNRWRTWANRPVMWALLLWLLDLVWVLGMHILVWIGRLFIPEIEFVRAVKWMENTAPITRAWNFVHLPIRRFVEPIMFHFFPFITPTYPGIWLLYVYEATCILQSLFVGYVFGLLIRWVLRSVGWGEPLNSKAHT